MNNVYFYKLMMGGYNSEILMIEDMIEINESELGFEVDGDMFGGGDGEGVEYLVSKKVYNNEDIDIEYGDCGLDEYVEKVEELSEKYFG